MSYSQNNEEEFLVKLFAGFTGRFLDIGAYDGVDMSNTRRLLELGWSGVLVEPSPHNLQNLIKNCDPFKDRTVLIQAAVSDRTGLARFWIDNSPGRFWSTTINQGLLESGSVIEPLKLSTFVMTCTMTDLEPFGPFDFISIDAEWEDLKVLRTIPVSMLENCKAICVEAAGHGGQYDLFRSIFSKIGFTVVHATPENLIAVPK